MSAEGRAEAGDESARAKRARLRAEVNPARGQPAKKPKNGAKGEGTTNTLSGGSGGGGGGPKNGAKDEAKEGGETDIKADESSDIHRCGGGDPRHYVPRFTMLGPMAFPMWVAIKNTSVPPNMEAFLVDVEKWESDAKDGKPLTLKQVRYAQAKASWYIQQVNTKTNFVMQGPEVYKIFQGDQLIASIWQPIAYGYKRLEIAFTDIGGHNALFYDLTVETILKLVNKALNGQGGALKGPWKRPANATARLDMVVA